MPLGPFHPESRSEWLPLKSMEIDSAVIWDVPNADRTAFSSPVYLGSDHVEWANLREIAGYLISVNPSMTVGARDVGLCKIATNQKSK